MPRSLRFDFAAYSGKGISIAIVDSGIDGTHPYLRGSLKGGVAMTVTPEGYVHLDDTYGDVAGHGTACAGLIKRIAPDSRLYSVRILDEKLKSYSELLVESIKWAVANNMNIVNMSLGMYRGGHKRILQEACDFASENNVLLVAASDRSGRRNYPAEFSNVFGVEENNMAGMYSYAFHKDGLVELSTCHEGYVLWSDHKCVLQWGSSFAAAHMTGIIALILESEPTMGYEAVREILMANAVQSGEERA